MTQASAERTFPFLHVRRIRFGDCDPAGIVYTGRFLDFALEAIESFFTDRLGASFYEFNADHGIGTPFVHVDLDFRSPATPRDTMEIEVRLVRMGGSSLSFVARGRVEGRLCFEGNLVCAFVQTRAPRLKPILVPEDVRARLAADLAFAAA